MEYVYATLLVVLDVAFLFAIILGLPGTWLMVLLAAFFAWWPRDDAILPLWVVIVSAAVALVGEVFEFFSGALGTKKAGGSRRGAVGALVGGVVGGILGTIFVPVPIVGSIAGMCVGAFALAASVEWLDGRSVDESLRSGGGAAAGRLLGVLGKFGVGVVIWILCSVAAFWP